jgi:putative transcriptional regulator
MAVCYDKLRKIMSDRKIRTMELVRPAGISQNILTRINRNEYISMESVEKICRVLNCGVDDILDFVPDTTIPSDKER